MFHGIAKPAQAEPVGFSQALQNALQGTAGRLDAVAIHRAAAIDEYFHGHGQGFTGGQPGSEAGHDNTQPFIETVPGGEAQAGMGQLVKNQYEVSVQPRFGSKTYFGHERLFGTHCRDGAHSHLVGG